MVGLWDDFAEKAEPIGAEQVVVGSLGYYRPTVDPTGRMSPLSLLPTLQPKEIVSTGAC
jgi:hypothetical protein